MQRLTGFEPPQDVADRLLGGRTQSTIQEVCAAEIAWTLRQFDERTRFAVWVFGDDVLRWGRGLVPATPSNADSAAGYVRGHTPAGETNFHGALAAALGLDEAGPDSASFAPGPDTITFLTDGTATSGELTDPEAYLVLEARGKDNPQWQFSLARFNGHCSMRAIHDDKEVWKAELLSTPVILNPKKPYFAIRTDR